LQLLVLQALLNTKQSAAMLWMQKLLHSSEYVFWFI